MNENAGRIISVAREKKGLTQLEMAVKLNISLRQYNKYESGDLPKFKREPIRKIDEILGTKIYELLYEQQVQSGNSGEGGNSTNAVLLPGTRKITIDDYIALLEKQNSELFEIIQISLNEIRGNTHSTLAYQKAWVEQVADDKSGGNQKKKDEIMTKMGILVDKFSSGGGPADIGDPGRK